MSVQTSWSLLLRDMGEDDLSGHRKNCRVSVRNHCNNAWLEINTWDLVTAAKWVLRVQITQKILLYPQFFITDWDYKGWVTHSLCLCCVTEVDIPVCTNSCFSNATTQTIKVSDNKKLQDSLTEQFKGKACEELLLSKATPLVGAAPLAQFCWTGEKLHTLQVFRLRDASGKKL